jgi:hypothetical protein
MSVHQPKIENIPARTRDSIVKHHIPYERWMMRESLAAALQGAPTRFQQNLQVEGFALHARNLIEFLKNGDGCGFNPADFTTEGFSVQRRFIRDTLVNMINRQISHLTDGRTEIQEGKFDESQWRETAQAIEGELDRWIANLSPEWAEKWKQRERMGDADGGFIKTAGHVRGACTAPGFVESHQNGTASVMGPTGPARTGICEAAANSSFKGCSHAEVVNGSWTAVLSRNHASRGAFLRAGWRCAGRRSVRLDRCASTRCATRLGLIRLLRRPVGARGPAAHGPDGISPSATARKSVPWHNTTYGPGNWCRSAPMRERSEEERTRRRQRHLARLTHTGRRPKLKSLKSDARIALTGTPIENRLGDLWSIFDFINPGPLARARRTDDADDLTGRHPQRDVMEHLRSVDPVAEGRMFESDVAAHRRQCGLARIVDRLRR